MTARDFAYWLQGFFEISDTDDVKPEQIRMIKAHLALVLTKVTPTMEELKKGPAENKPVPWKPERKVFDPSPYPFDDKRLVCAAEQGLIDKKTILDSVGLPATLTITNGSDVASNTVGTTTTTSVLEIAHGITNHLTC